MCVGVGRQGHSASCPLLFPQHFLLLTLDACWGPGILGDDAQAPFPSRPLRGMEGLPTLTLPPPPTLGLLLFTCSLGLSEAAPSTPYGWELGWASSLDKRNRNTPFRESPIHGSLWFRLFPSTPRTLSCLK